MNLNNPFKPKEEILEKKEPVQAPKINPQPNQPKVNVVQAPQKPLSSDNNRAQTVVLSKEYAYIQDVMRSQPSTLEEVEVEMLGDANPNHHRLSLPPEIQKHENRFTFHWIYKNERAISEAIQLKGWRLVNRNYFPELPNHLFGSSGGVERGDNILGFMNRAMADSIRLKAANRSTESVKSRIGAHKGNPNFYTPADKSEEGETAKVVGL